MHWFYPTERFFGPFSEADYVSWAQITNGDPLPRPLSIDVNLDPRQSGRDGCACNGEPSTAKQGPACDSQRLLDALERDIAQKGKLFDKDRGTECIRIRGLSRDLQPFGQLKPLLSHIADLFSGGLAPDQHSVVELDSDTLDEGLLAELRDLGLRGLTIRETTSRPGPLLGPASVDLSRGNPGSSTRHGIGQAVSRARALGFESVTYVDPRFGQLPQPDSDAVRAASATLARAHLEALLDQQPDRICLSTSLPRAPAGADALQTLAHLDDAQLNELEAIMAQFESAGYVPMGGSAFGRQPARPGERFCMPHLSGHRTDLVGIGVGAISALGWAYAQNHRRPEQFMDAIARGRLPVERGIIVNQDDQMRREIIAHLLSDGRIDAGLLSRRWEVDFDRHFQPELRVLDELAARGALRRDADTLTVTRRGHLLLPQICRLFDRYARHGYQPNRVIHLADRRPSG
ncbi:MAG: hypothetical protein KDK91_09375 [Gammaproteobacteria bacterium]|nr:hypothetical protein [Gammaproteobacteria bacterium]